MKTQTISGKLDTVNLVREVSREKFAAMPRPQRIPNKKRRNAMDVAAESCGLKKVRGALGGTYYE